MRARAIALLALALGLAVVPAGCGGGASDTRTLTVLAAASLTEPFDSIATAFEAAHPGVRVRLAFGSSATLAAQVADGAPADVLATADERTMTSAADAGGLAAGTAPTHFADNVLVLVTPASDPGGVHGVADLNRPGVSYLTCVPSAPCGAAAAALLDRLGVQRTPVSQEVDVKAVLTKIVAGEADAGVVYRTDGVAAGAKVRSLPLPGAGDSPNTYWLATTANATEPDLARAWIAFVQGPSGRSVLDRDGFLAP